MKILKDRELKISERLNSAEKDEQAAKKTLEEYQKQLADARVQAQEIVDKAMKQAQKEHDLSIEQTKREIEQMRKTAKEDIERERERAAQHLKDEVVLLSMQAASKVIAANLDSDANEKLINEFVEKLDKSKLGDLSC